MDNKKEIYYNTLNAPAYSIAEASRLVSMPRWTITRYLQGYEYDYSYLGHTQRTTQPPVIKNEKERENYASFLDLIDLLLVKELLKRGFGLPTLRKALNEAREHLGTHHFARSVFFTSGSQIILKLPKDGNLIALLTGGQSAIPQIIESLSEKLEFEKITEYGFANKWYPKGLAGQIVIDPEVSFGRPSLIGTGIPTNNIYDLYLGENKKIKPVSKWFNISAPQIQAAVHFEHSLWA
ncbi:MAG: DUF433 domain-containing protein [Anaerolineales bacterium]|nr:DUF433 domain-containing protein [Anaerolineales bacterium]